MTRLIGNVSRTNVRHSAQDRTSQKLFTREILVTISIRFV
jgi:hypothetical protein